MKPLQFTIYDNPAVKKNNQKVVWTGRYHKKVNTPSYNRWHQSALQQLMLIRRQLPTQPIDEPVNMQVHFYMKTRGRVDLSALYEGIQDVLVEMKVLKDDYFGIVAGHDGSRVYHDKNSPRMVVEITPMKDWQRP